MNYLFSDGTKKIIDANEPVWSISRYDRDDNLYIIDLFTSIYGIDINLDKIQKYKAIMTRFRAHQKSYLSCGINYDDFSPDVIYPAALLNRLHKIEEEIIDCVAPFILRKNNISYYKNNVVKYINAILSVGTYKINLNRFNAYSSISQFSKCVPKDFRPTATTNKMWYRMNTRTGRNALINSRSFNILSCPKEYRNFIESKWDGGRICSIDYNSFDVRSLSLYCEKFMDQDDIYEFILKSFDEKIVYSKTVFKPFVLALLYGSNLFHLGVSLGLPQFTVEALIEHIKWIFSGAFEYFKNVNIFGRPIPKIGERMRMAYMGQSTSADIFNHMLIDVIKYSRENNLRSNIIALIHDQIMIDVHPDENNIVEKIKEIVENRLINGKAHRFPVKIIEEK